jgi:hypothetical protein
MPLAAVSGPLNIVDKRHLYSTLKLAIRFVDSTDLLIIRQIDGITRRQTGQAASDGSRTYLNYL